MIEIGRVEAIFRYPVKSMRGELMQAAELGWHGVAGDRRLAFRRINNKGGFPWLSASNVAELLLYTPRTEVGSEGDLPTHIRTPAGQEFSIYSEELAAEMGQRYGSPVEMMHVRQGIFDDASISVITTVTVEEIGKLADQNPEVRRFRPNIVVRAKKPVPFQEEEWLGGSISFGVGADAPSVGVTMRDARCSIINLDPDSAKSSPGVLKSVVRANANNAGVYGTVTRTGQIKVGQPVFLRPAEE